MKDIVLEKISTAALEKILDINNLENIHWIWMNREILRDTLLNLELDKMFGEESLEKCIDEITDEEFVQALLPSFKGKKYFPMNQYEFAELEKEYKPTTDIETTIFVKDKYKRQLLIRQINEYAWMLKAMAIDTYLRMGLDYKTLQETYEELYEENSRILQDILWSGEYVFSSGKWKFIKKTKELYFYKVDKFYHAWAEGEVLSKFEEMINS
ncbi:hypothetical protein QBE52_05925 [Clostridiaceae bacterium 35-E11]